MPNWRVVTDLRAALPANSLQLPTGLVSGILWGPDPRRTARENAQGSRQRCGPFAMIGKAGYVVGRSAPREMAGAQPGNAIKPQKEHEGPRLGPEIPSCSWWRPHPSSRCASGGAIRRAKRLVGSRRKIGLLHRAPRCAALAARTFRARRVRGRGAVTGSVSGAAGTAASRSVFSRSAIVSRPRTAGLT